MNEASGPGPAELVFVGGTGRSGTHVVASLLGEHSRFASVPIECRFHCNPNGLADLVDGRTTPEEFVDKLRRFWWHRVRVGGRGTVRLRRLAARRGGEAKVRGLHKITTRARAGGGDRRVRGDRGRRRHRRLARPLLLASRPLWQRRRGSPPSSR